MTMPITIQYDTIIRHGDLIDGTGAPRRAADIAIQDGAIAAIGDLRDARAATEIDATGLAVTPGFIDTHTHDDWLVFQSPEMLPKVTQGVTTIIAGNCGISLFPLVTRTIPPAPLDILRGGYQFPSVQAYRDAFAAAPAAVNVAVLVGQSTLRARHVGQLGAAASDAEIERMREDVETALRQGAIGVSTGTFYPPSAAAPEDEIVRMCEPMRRLGGVLVSHMRDESDRVREAIDETARIGKALGVSTVISHHKLVGKQNHGRSRETLAQVSELARTMPLCMDCYPYAASSTMLRPERVDQCDRILITWSSTHPDVAGRYLEEIAEAWGRSRREVAEALVPGGAVYFIMDEGDVRDILAYPDTMVGSDGIPSDETPHPRLWGTFPRVLGLYSRDLGLFPLERAVHKMTGLAARRFGLERRGELRVGHVADITVFDPATIQDRATFDDPVQPSIGVVHVLVAGEATLRDGMPTGNRPGRFVGSTLVKGDAVEVDAIKAQAAPPNAARAATQ
ncbi:N-acyl-D-amino-acid deacylase family protein [Cupriavidus plantarum]|uniref:N-acyl-D-amino-acid deacylase family protein n=1 Tax=Cupriavidus plantarum TaxID=942865 RepID=UPI000E3A8FD5|nr:D-aminoacylase [Cupriavidus plantarum]NYH97983.1 N-acyl-D-amino-acid deacylase [Cupriavidus plantarum]REE92039.1 N-acyl-D-amino-acid deacylase [Cupriavidus plantarum]